jgi:hypothetical protein
MSHQFSDEKFIELDNVRIVDLGYKKGYNILKWVPDKDNDSVGQWKQMYHAGSSKMVIKYIHRLEKHIEEDKDEAEKKNSGS